MKDDKWCCSNSVSPNKQNTGVNLTGFGNPRLASGGEKRLSAHVPVSDFYLWLFSVLSHSIYLRCFRALPSSGVMSRHCSPPSVHISDRSAACFAAFFFSCQSSPLIYASWHVWTRRAARPIGRLPLRSVGVPFQLTCACPGLITVIWGLHLLRVFLYECVTQTDGECVIRRRQRVTEETPKVCSGLILEEVMLTPGHIWATVAQGALVRSHTRGTLDFSHVQNLRRAAGI